MAELPDIRPGWPQPAPPRPGALRPVRPIGGAAPRFGVAHDLDLIQQGPVPPPSRASSAAAAHRRAAPPPEPRPGDRFRTWWADSDLHPSDLWHRLHCRFGRHDIQGGRQIQIGGRFVNTERCCVWCRAKPQ